jgi:hypothetical protein
MASASQMMLISRASAVPPLLRFVLYAAERGQLTGTKFPWQPGSGAENFLEGVGVLSRSVVLGYCRLALRRRAQPSLTPCSS